MVICFLDFLINSYSKRWQLTSSRNNTNPRTCYGLLLLFTARKTTRVLSDKTVKNSDIITIFIHTVVLLHIMFPSYHSPKYNGVLFLE